MKLLCHFAVFIYDRNQHNVVAVNRNGYVSCQVSPPNARVYTSGHDEIKLEAGLNYFISSIPGDCQEGMKIVVLGRYIESY